MNKRYLILVMTLALALVPVLAHATARLTNVTPVAGGCVFGPTGPAVQAWDIETGFQYTITIEGVTECAEGGTAATLGIRVASTSAGNKYPVATFVAPGVYEFIFYLREDWVCTFPIYYCAEPNDDSTGIVVIRNDGVPFQAHLRAATFEPGCTNPVETIGSGCDVVEVEESSWGTLKASYK